MKTKVFYFSATGNSLLVAQDIEKRINDVELISIPDVMERISEIKASRIGLVFPVYAYGLPRIVEDFVSQVRFSKAKYVFAVATCGGIQGNSLVQLKNMLKKNGSNLNAGFAVNQGSHTFLDENAFMKLMVNLSGTQPLSFDERVEDISKIIENNEEHELETSKRAANFIGSRIHKIALRQFKEAGRDFWINDKCRSCKICVKICPRNNIRIIDNKPVWSQDCESCFSCLQWCPQEAVEYKDVSIDKKRSHNKKVDLEDIIMQ